MGRPIKSKAGEKDIQEVGRIMLDPSMDEPLGTSDRDASESRLAELYRRIGIPG